MTTTTMTKAWEIAHTMIDNLQYDADRTERGSGKTWSKPDTNATVIDLGTRLEVNKENGETVNIWIEEPKKETKKSTTFEATVTYQIHDNSVMTKIVKGVTKAEYITEKWNGENTLLFRVSFGGYNGATWAAGAILHVSMTPER